MNPYANIWTRKDMLMKSSRHECTGHVRWTEQCVCIYVCRPMGHTNTYKYGRVPNPAHWRQVKVLFKTVERL